MKKYNFNAGPAILPRQVIESSSAAVKDLNNSGLSLIEISHRSSDFQAILDEAVALTRELLNVPENYSVLFCHGGASLQFCMIPYNLTRKENPPAYLETGVWAKKAIKEARLFSEVEVVASSADDNFNHIPTGYSVPENASYFHVTSNNTIYGTQMHTTPETTVPLVVDMSSDIFSRPVDLSKHALIYAGTQKNLGTAGVTMVIIKNDILGNVDREIPSMLNYQTHIDNGSMFNTPSVFAIYTALQTLKWLKSLGGLEAVQKQNEDKAKILYDEIDTNPLFSGTAKEEDRSLMNITFVMEDKELEQKFLEEANSNNFIGIKGHRLVGGFRASIYNAMPKESIEALVSLMQEFANKNN
ncbi:MAG: 3-phosphoserine/phosphohydroxythreonine transaminase [Bacteroidetes bacterium]|nr:3-phosphoserine/phosphohydroxythreonine transaminase [Bacteroidota bacterium]